MHTLFSDGSASIDDMAQSAIEKGLTQISITDHMPLPKERRYTMGKERVDEYRRAIKKAQSVYSNDLAIRMGIEMEYIPKFRFWVRSILEMEWEAAIASIHSLCLGNDLFLVNGTNSEFENLLGMFNNDIKALLETYFNTLHEALDTGWFDIAGHLDVIKKHNTGEKYFSESDPCYRAMVCDALDIIKHRDMKMEINMAGLNHPVQKTYPSPWIIKEALEMDIPLVLSSDAHCPGDIGQHFNRVDAVLKDKVAVML